MNCRFDGKPINKVFVDLGFSPASNSFLSEKQLNECENYYPLKLYVSERSFLVQVDEFKKHDDIFSEDYVYFSSFSTSWLKHSEEYVKMMIARFGYNQNSYVAEIASNDGYLLQYFKKNNVPVLGIEPTKSTAEVSKAKGIENVIDFFGVRLAEKLSIEKPKADLLLGNNVLAHVPDINDFVKGLSIYLNAGGVVTMEFPHLYQLVKHNQFDTIYHEHFSYLSFYTVSRIFAAHNLTIFDVEEIPTHGGSLRIFATHAHENIHSITNKITALIDKELKAGINTLAYYDGFQERVESIKNEFISFLLNAKKQQKKVVGYGAAAKGNTLINYCGLKTDLIQFVVDASPYKQNKFLPGSHIPVVDESRLKELQPDYIIIFPWNIKEEIVAQLNYATNWGAKFVIALPELQII